MQLVRLDQDRGTGFAGEESFSFSLTQQGNLVLAGGTQLGSLNLAQRTRLLEAAKQSPNPAGFLLTQIQQLATLKPGNDDSDLVQVVSLALAGAENAQVFSEDSQQLVMRTYQWDENQLATMPAHEVDQLFSQIALQNPDSWNRVVFSETVYQTFAEVASALVQKLIECAGCPTPQQSALSACEAARTFHPQSGFSSEDHLSQATQAMEPPFTQLEPNSPVAKPRSTPESIPQTPLDSGHFSGVRASVRLLHDPKQTPLKHHIPQPEPIAKSMANQPLSQLTHQAGSAETKRLFQAPSAKMEPIDSTSKFVGQESGFTPNSDVNPQWPGPGPVLQEHPPPNSLEGARPSLLPDQHDLDERQSVQPHGVDWGSEPSGTPFGVDVIKPHCKSSKPQKPGSKQPFLKPAIAYSPVETRFPRLEGKSVPSPVLALEEILEHLAEVLDEEADLRGYLP